LAAKLVAGEQAERSQRGRLSRAGVPFGAISTTLQLANALFIILLALRQRQCLAAGECRAPFGPSQWTGERAARTQTKSAQRRQATEMNN